MDVHQELSLQDHLCITQQVVWYSALDIWALLPTYKSERSIELS